MKLIIGGIAALIVGAGCRFFDLEVPSPPVLPGALLVCPNDVRLRDDLAYDEPDNTHAYNPSHCCVIREDNQRRRSGGR